MIVTAQSWKKLFLFCLGLTAAAAFCMKWMESDFWSGNEKFTILGLELFYTWEKLMEVLQNMSEPVKNILRYHLSFDFPFMAGVYPGICALCMMAKEKTRSKAVKKILFVLAALQVLAWTADIVENYYLFQWIDEPVITDKELGLFHLIVWTKWIIALTGVVFMLPWIFRRNRNKIT